jgi:hypothetical protein
MLWLGHTSEYFTVTPLANLWDLGLSTLFFTFPHFFTLFYTQPANAADTKPKKQPETSFSKKQNTSVVLPIEK